MDLREKLKLQQLQKQLASQKNIQDIKEEVVLEQMPSTTIKMTGLEWKVHKATKLKQIMVSFQVFLNFTILICFRKLKKKVLIWIELKIAHTLCKRLSNGMQSKNTNLP